MDCPPCRADVHGFHAQNYDFSQERLHSKRFPGMISPNNKDSKIAKTEGESINAEKNERFWIHFITKEGGILTQNLRDGLKYLGFF